MSDVTSAVPSEVAGISPDHETEYLTFYVGEQTFGVPVLLVQDVLKTPKLTRIPLAPPEVAGALNLRGRIITAIDIRTRLSLEPLEEGAQHMSIVVEHGDELYNLIVDRVGEVLRVRDDAFEQIPGNLDSKWSEYCSGIYRLETSLVLVFDIDRLLEFANRAP